MLYREELYLNLNVGMDTHDLSNEGSLFQIEEELNKNDFTCLDNLFVIDGVFEGRVGMNEIKINYYYRITENELLYLQGKMQFRNTVQYNLFEKELIYYESDVI